MTGLSSLVCVAQWHARHSYTDKPIIVSHGCVHHRRYCYTLQRSRTATLLRSALALYLSAVSALVGFVVTLAHALRMANCGDQTATQLQRPCVVLNDIGLSASDFLQAMQVLVHPATHLTQEDVDDWAERAGISDACRLVGLSVADMSVGLLLCGLGGFFSLGPKLLAPILWRAALAFQSRGFSLLLLGSVGIARILFSLLNYVKNLSRVMLEQTSMVVVDVGGGAAAADAWRRERPRGHAPVDVPGGR
jgi:hypothetical protein